MKLNNLILFLITFLFIGFPSRMEGKPLGISTLDNRQGLSSSTVKALMQDDLGLIWVGTKNGLNRYDGVSVKTYNVFDKVANRGNNNVSALYQDADGTIWIGTDRGVYLLDPKRESFSIMNPKSKDGVSPDDWVHEITCDLDHNHWVLIPNQGVFRFNTGTPDFYTVTNHKGNKELLPNALLATSNGKVFVGTSKDGIYIYEKVNNSFRNIGSGRPEFDCLRHESVVQLIENGPGILIFLRNGETFSLDMSDESITPISIPFSCPVNLHRVGIVDNELWIGTDEGLWTYDLMTHNISHIYNHGRRPNTISDNCINVITPDADKNIWVGTMYGGLNHIRRHGLVFESFTQEDSENPLSSDRIRGMCTDDAGRIWIGTEANGLNVYDPCTNRISQPLPTDPRHKICLSLMNHNGRILAGFSQGGLNVIEGNRVVDNIGNSLISQATSAYAVAYDREGNMWISGDWGVYRKDKDAADFQPVKEMEMDWVVRILQDSRGSIWFASMGNGIWRYDPLTKGYRHYAYDESHSNGLRSNSVCSVMEDSNGHIWFSTERGGLVKYNESTDNFTSYGVEEGLPDDMVYDVLEDSRGFLWFGTGRGLVKFNPSTGGVKVFNENNGLDVTQFNYSAATKGRDGKFYMGGLTGVVAFNPLLDTGRDTLPPVYLTRFRIGNEESMATDGNHEPINVLYSDAIDIPWGINSFSLGVSSPAYDTPNTMVYSCRLLPKEKEWTIIPDPSNLSFVGLAAGNYTLEIRAQSDTAESIKQVKLRILPPWYQTTWALILFIILGVGIILGGLWLFRRRQLDKVKEQEQIFTMSQEKELYKSKMRFFTEIAHEIRTPLTLIGTPLEAIEEIGVDDKRVQNYMAVIRQNTNRLMDLSTQLLDFQKLDSERPDLKFDSVNITELLREIIGRFEATITLKQKALSVDIPSKPIIAHCDKEAVTKIISNLLNNALKYSASKISVTLTANDTAFRLKVVSDGNKIAGEDVFRIFMPFYQIDKNNDNKGVGIGLPLTRTLATMHAGTIELEDLDGVDNTFVLTIPLRREGVETVEMDTNPTMAEYVMEEETTSLTAPAEGYSLLFVDDNDEMRDFLRDQLSRSFLVETAASGEEALDKLKTSKFDIIVTDIMMPEMDGYELCRRIKEDAEMSHIPVVFLTAKNDLESKVKALKTGGEAYIEKPFSIKYFRQQVMALIENRRQERKAFLNKPFFSVDNMKLNPADEEFMNKVIEVITNNISDENFSVEGMADIMCMSRSSLLRKIKTIFNLSPVELIRLVRLKKAAELIQEGKYRIADVCFMVGINSSSYFSKLFYKQFGVTPKAFEKQCQKNTHIILTTTSRPETT